MSNKTAKMKPATLKALHKSIDHWFDLKENGGPAVGDDCALCKMFYWGSADCQRLEEKCPVFAKTGKTDCSGSPYHYEPNKRQATAEINFLISLLPKKEQRPYWYD